MLNVDCVKNDLLDELTYIIANKSNCLIVDPGSNFNDIIDFIKGHNLNICGILLTHGHYDHIASCKKLQDLGYKIYISSEDADKCENNQKNLSSSFSNRGIPTFKPDYLISNEQTELTIDDFKVIILHVPGHSKGGLAYIIENHIFVGDTIFPHGYGRYDFYDGNFSELIKSMSLNKDGSFSAHAKIISEEESNKMIEYTKNKIEEATNNILSAKFDINPKILNIYP